MLQIVLTVEEKIHILTHKFPDKLLNKRSELIARCRHKTKFKLKKKNFFKDKNSETRQKTYPIYTQGKNR